MRSSLHFPICEWIGAQYFQVFSCDRHEVEFSEALRFYELTCKTGSEQKQSLSLMMSPQVRSLHGQGRIYVSHRIEELNQT